MLTLFKKWHTIYNSYFLLPFMAWVVTGGMMLWSYNRHQLFLTINNYCSDPADKIIYYVTWLGQAEIIAPVLLLIAIIPRFRNWWYITTAILCNAVPFFIQYFIKDRLNWPRPRLVFGDVGVHFCADWPKLLHSSFPSGHTEGAFTFFCFLSLLLTTKYRKAGLLFFLLAMAVAHSRIYLAAHFFEDVYAGSIIGTLGVILTYSVMVRFKKYFLKEKELI